MTETFPPQIDDRGRVKVGDVTLFELREEGQLIVQDRFRQRCRERGTDNVSVDLVELLDALLQFYREQRI